MAKINFFNIARVVIITVVVGALGWGVFYTGYRLGTQGREVIIAGVINQETKKPTEVDFGVFWEAWQLIRRNYFKSDEVDNQALVYGAIEGLFRSLNDPHSIFLTPEDSKKFEEDISGEFSGVGMEIGIQKNQLVVIAPLKGTPAEQGGLRAGDMILKVDDTFTADLTVEEAVRLIRGPKGTSVALLIMREEWERPQEFTIVRDVITIPALEYTVRDDRIAYLKLFNFNDNVPYEFHKVAVDMLLRQPRGIVLDLRNNPGGFLEVSVNVAGWFLERGSVVTKEQFKNGEGNIFRATGNNAFGHLPMVVLINEGSASAAEILAGALRDHRKILLIGQKTFGKGSVQEVRMLEDGSSAKISIAQWLTPKNNLIDGIGLEPDIAVELTSHDINEEKDPQFEKAIEVLKSQL